MQHRDLPTNVAPAIEPAKPIAALDEVGAKRIERELVEFGSRLTESLLAIDWLKAQLGGEKCGELLERIRARTNESESDLARLMAEATTQLRGEQ